MFQMLTFFVHPIFAFGHYQIATTVCQELVRRGHQVWFFATDNLEQRLMANEANKEFKIKKPKIVPDDFKETLDKFCKFKLNEYDLHLEIACLPYQMFMNEHQRFKQEIESILDEIKPDIVITDQIVSVPNYIARQIPWIQIISMNILAYGHPDLPPRDTGIPFKTNDKQLWIKYKNKKDQYMEKTLATLDEFYHEFGLTRGRKDSTFEESQFLNIYCRPKELDYVDDPSVWGNHFVRFETLIRTEKTTNFDFSFEKLNNLPGHLIFFSLGTVATLCEHVMHDILKKLGQVKHRFIVSLGVHADKYNVPDNCVGHEFVPQTLLLQQVDAFVSHGGNNSLLEGLYYGVPMVVMPVFMDQLDNARRMEEEDLGKRMCFIEFTPEQLENELDELINNQERLKRIKALSKRLKTSDNISKACDLIEQRWKEYTRERSKDKENILIE